MKAELLLLPVLLLASVAAHAGEPPLDKAFLEYLEQFADDRGEVFDPGNLDETPPASQADTRAQRADKGAPADARESRHHD
jgi:hypothetical protein